MPTPSSFVRTVHVWYLNRVTSVVERFGDHNSERGQATTEYALVLLGAAAVAMLLLAWATAGGGAGRIGRLLDQILESITSRVA